MPAKALDKELIRAAKLVDSTLSWDWRLKYDGNIPQNSGNLRTGVELLYSNRTSGNQMRVTINMENEDAT